jgi:hypothetical protein
MRVDGRQITERLWVVLSSDAVVDVVFDPAEGGAEGLSPDEADAAAAALAEFAARARRMAP